MSHFMVLVVTSEKPTDLILSSVLQPWNENNLANPDPRWDWWVLGGRWCGMLRAHGDSDGIDACRVGDLDLDTMRDVAVRRRMDAVNKALSDYCDVAIVSRDQALEHCREFVEAIAGLRVEYAGLPSVTLFADLVKASKHPAILRDFSMGMSGLLTTVYGEYVGIGVPENRADLDVWASEAEALSTFAVVKDGKWFEKGKMGWFACVEDEKPPEVWQGEVDSIIHSLSPDSWVSVVDCHI